MDKDQSGKQEETESLSQVTAVAAQLAHEKVEENESDVYAYGHLTLEDKLESGVASVDGPSRWHGGDTDHDNLEAKEVAAEMGDPALENTEQGVHFAPEDLPSIPMEGTTEVEFSTDESRTLLRAPLSVAERIPGPSTGSFDPSRKGGKKRVDNKKSENETSSDSVRLSSCDVESSPQSPSSTLGARKLSKKRMRRVGVSIPKKQGKTESPDPMMSVNTDSTGVTTSLPDSMPPVLSKHDEKWNSMFDKLVAFKSDNDSSTLVPQCYDQEPRLGRWVHYQRVEYWIHQQSGNGKITPERIARLEALGFEWDPQRAQWNMMYEKLIRFKEEIGHCKVPKGYTKDPELANWVRNQRLEHVNMTKGKKSRMTEDRFQKLDTMGFKWSIATLPKGTSSAFHGETLTPAEEKQPPPLSEEGRSVQGASHNDTVESTASLEGGEIISTSAELACNPKGETVELPSADATHFTEI